MFVKTLLKRLRRSVLERSGLATAEQLRNIHTQISEVIYQKIFLSKNHPLAFYPVGAAANYSLLYLIDRIMEENDVSRVIEFGSGQTTLLFNVWRKEKSFEFFSIEHDELWRAEIARKTHENIILCPLKTFSYGGVDTTFYDMSDFNVREKFDLILIDGPPAYMYNMYARLGVIEFLKTHAAADFIVIFDDADRVGEQTSIKEVGKILSDNGIKFDSHVIRGLKWQHVFLTNKFKRVKYY